MVLNERLSRREFPAQGPVGKRIRFGFSTDEDEFATVIGVVADLKYSKLDAEPEAELYLPYHQASDMFAFTVVVQAALVDPIIALRHE